MRLGAESKSACMKERRRIALYGGTFDPVHVGHLSVARRVASLFALDEVIFIPAYVAPHKRERVVSPPLHRYAMLALATQDEERFRISTAELDAPERPFTVNTLAYFRETLGDEARLFFIMGADSWAEITTWREWERLLTMENHIVVTRPRYELSTEHVTDGVRAMMVDLRGRDTNGVGQVLEENRDAKRIYLTDAVRLDLSATAVRRAARQSEDGAELASLVPPTVAAYIKKYRLYRDTQKHDTQSQNTGNAH